MSHDQTDDDCDECEGEGGYYVVIGSDPWDGSPIEESRLCPKCNGSGSATRPREDDDPEPRDDNYEIPQYWHPEPRDAR